MELCHVKLVRVCDLSLVIGTALYSLYATSLALAGPRQHVQVWP